jgi:hypothetical protein
MSLFNPEDCFSPDTFFGLPNPRSLDLCILQVCRMTFVFECRARASSEHTADLRGNHSIHAAHCEALPDTISRTRQNHRRWLHAFRWAAEVHTLLDVARTRVLIRFSTCSHRRVFCCAERTVQLSFTHRCTVLISARIHEFVHTTLSFQHSSTHLGTYTPAR